MVKYYHYNYETLLLLLNLFNNNDFLNFSNNRIDRNAIKFVKIKYNKIILRIFSYTL